MFGDDEPTRWRDMWIGIGGALGVIALGILLFWIVTR